MVHARPHGLAAQLHVAKTWMDGSTAMGELGFCLTTLQCAVDLLLSMDPANERRLHAADAFEPLPAAPKSVILESLDSVRDIVGGQKMPLSAHAMSDVRPTPHCSSPCGGRDSGGATHAPCTRERCTAASDQPRHGVDCLVTHGADLAQLPRPGTLLPVHALCHIATRHVSAARVPACLQACS